MKQQVNQRVIYVSFFGKSRIFSHSQWQDLMFILKHFCKLNTLQSYTSVTGITERKNVTRVMSKVIVSTKTKKDKTKTALYEALFNTEEQANTVQRPGKTFPCKRGTCY